PRQPARVNGQRGVFAEPTVGECGYLAVQRCTPAFARVCADESLFPLYGQVFVFTQPARHLPRTIESKDTLSHALTLALVCGRYAFQKVSQPLKRRDIAFRYVRDARLHERAGRLLPRR